MASQTSYDSLDRPTSHYAFGKLVAMDAWNADGTLASVTDGDGHTTTLSSWYRGLPQTVTYADGTHESATVNDAGWITSLTDEDGFATNYAYDPMGRLSQISYPTGDDVAWNPMVLSFAPVAGSEYGIPAGHWKQTVHTGNDYTVTYFDAFWRPLVSEHYDAGNRSATLSQVVTRYDAAGRKVFTSYPTRAATSYTQALPGDHTSHDALDRVTEVDQDSELGTLKTTTAYLSGFQTRTTDPRGNSTLTTYQAYGQPTTKYPDSITAPEGELSVIMRDAFGKPISLTRTGTAQGSLQLTRYYVYDTRQQLCKRIDPETGATAFGYDAAGNLSWSASGLSLPATTTCDSSVAYASGRRSDRRYDAHNRIVSLTFPDGNGNQTWAYTPDGLPSEITRQNTQGANDLVTNTYTYNARGMLTSEGLRAEADWPTWTVGYEYDANGHLADRVYPDGSVVAYAPNALGQPTQAGSYATGATYYPDGKLAHFAFGNGIVHTLTENVRHLPASITDTGGGVTPINQTYSYDADGDLTTLGDTGNSQQNRTMSYDGLDRLSAATVAYAGTTPSRYGYDVLDNLVEVSQGTHGASYQYNLANQLSQLVDSDVGTTTYTYDPQGNLSSKDGVAYSFDYGNRLRAVIGQQAYRYDGLGRRVLGVATIGGAGIHSMYTRAGQLVFRRDYGTDVTDAYVYLGARLVAIVEHPFAGGSNTRYQHTDYQGTVVAQTAASGAVLSRSVYASFGLAWNHGNDDGPGYTGHVQDSLTGITYMQQRYYDPVARRFLSVDPITANADTGGNFNRYWYANDNPYKYIDPDGRTCTKVGKSYSCQIDYVATRNAKGKVVMTRATAADHKQYAAVEQSLTRAVNAAAASNKVEHISVKNGSATYSFSISAKKIASQLAGRNMIIDAFDSDTKSAMNTVGSTGYTNIHAAGIDPTQGHPGWRTDFGNADRTRQVEFLHEGIHGSPEEAQGFGKALPGLGREPLSTEHVIPYNNAAVDILGPNQ
ncbi:MAG TPA: RHS repeat-associated core domain-containing protein [Rhodanobacteraceae bacterium]|nr:RHS repeat-associated core domain-containing protein [Rhodanobacteraceae bacterium]